MNYCPLYCGNLKWRFATSTQVSVKPKSEEGAEVSLPPSLPPLETEMQALFTFSTEMIMYLHEKVFSTHPAIQPL